MLNVKVNFEKNAVSKTFKNGNFVLELKGEERKQSVKVDRKVLNISVCLDVSGSMSQYLTNNYCFDNHFVINNGMTRGIQGQGIQFANQFEGRLNKSTKIEKAKEMVREIILSLKDGDVFSLVTFDGLTKVEQEAIVIKESEKALLLQKVNMISTRGSTNIYGGWEAAAKENAKYLKEGSLNRIILLSDGQDDSGMTYLDKISQRASAMAKIQLETTTIGIGDNFNEKYLSTVAESGLGNFYYVNTDDSFSDVFKNEFGGLTSVAISNASVSFDLEKGVSVKQLNGFKEENGVFNVPAIRTTRETKVMFSFEVDKVKGKTAKLGTIKISGIDNEGKKVTYTEEISLPVVTDSDYEAMASDGEIKVEIALMEVAIKQQEASDMLLNGNAQGARDLMQNSVSLLGSLNSEKATVMAASINDSLSMNENVMSKFLRSESYSTRYSNDDKK